MHSDLRKQWNKALEDRGLSDDCPRCGGRRRPGELFFSETDLDAPDILEALEEEHCIECGHQLVHWIGWGDHEDGGPFMPYIQVPLWRGPLRPD